MIRSVRGYEEFVNLVKTRRRELQQSLLQASKEVGVSQSTLSVFERKRSISDESVVAIAKWVSVDYQAALNVKRAYFANAAAAKARRYSVQPVVPVEPEIVEPVAEPEPEPVNVTMPTKPEVKPVVSSTPADPVQHLLLDREKKIRRSASLNTVLLVGLIAALLGSVVLAAGAYMHGADFSEQGEHAMAIGFGYLFFGGVTLLFGLIHKVLDEVRGD